MDNEIWATIVVLTTIVFSTIFSYISISGLVKYFKNFDYLIAESMVNEAIELQKDSKLNKSRKKFM